MEEISEVKKVGNLINTIGYQSILNKQISEVNTYNYNISEIKAKKRYEQYLKQQEGMLNNALINTKYNFIVKRFYKAKGHKTKKRFICK